MGIEVMGIKRRAAPRHAEAAVLLVAEATRERLLWNRSVVPRCAAAAAPTTGARFGSVESHTSAGVTARPSCFRQARGARRRPDKQPPPRAQCLVGTGYSRGERAEAQVPCYTEASCHGVVPLT